MADKQGVLYERFFIRVLSVFDPVEHTADQGFGIKNCESDFEFVTHCKCQYKNAQKVENKNVRFPGSIPQLVLP